MNVDGTALALPRALISVAEALQPNCGELIDVAAPAAVVVAFTEAVVIPDTVVDAAAAPVVPDIPVVAIAVATVVATDVAAVVAALVVQAAVVSIGAVGQPQP